jgi:hypothetical protein
MGVWLSLKDSVCIQVQPSVEFPFPSEGCAAAPCFEGNVTHNIPAKCKRLSNRFVSSLLFLNYLYVKVEIVVQEIANTGVGKFVC